MPYILDQAALERMMTGWGQPKPPDPGAPPKPPEVYRAPPVDPGWENLQSQRWLLGWKGRHGGAWPTEREISHYGGGFDVPYDEIPAAVQWMGYMDEVSAWNIGAESHIGKQKEYSEVTMPAWQATSGAWQDWTQLASALSGRMLSHVGAAHEWEPKSYEIGSLERMIGPRERS